MRRIYMANQVYLNITKHAAERAALRFGWDVNTLYIKAILALEEGLLAIDDEFLADLFKYTTKNQTGIIYYHDGAVFIFDEDRVITVYSINGRIQGGL
jgi:hypothetical protein